MRHLTPAQPPTPTPGVHAVKPVSLEHAKALFDYVDGALYWRMSQSNKRIVAGGYYASRGKWVVSVDRRRIPAVYLVWLLVHGTWPDGILTTLGDPSDLRIENIATYSHEEEMLAKVSPKAWDNLQERTAAARQRYEREWAEAQHLQRYTPKGVRYARGKFEISGSGSIVATGPGKWCVYGDVFEGASALAVNKLLGSFRDMDEATMFAEELVEGRRMVLDFANPCINHDMRATLTRIKATQPNSKADVASLADFHDYYVYDPDFGFFYHREPSSRVGFRADVLGPDGDRFLYLPVPKPRRYPAHMVAWMMMTGKWPAQKSIVHKDGNIANNSIDNLEIRK